MKREAVLAAIEALRHDGGLESFKRARTGLVAAFRADAIDWICDSAVEDDMFGAELVRRAFGIEEARAKFVYDWAKQIDAGRGAQ